MTNAQFQKLFEDEVKRDRETLIYKASVYAITYYYSKG
jgi:hypothetical protein